jgi:chemosensory pili system protein ChpA (sensor histidine kinase/response regulator)
VAGGLTTENSSIDDSRVSSVPTANQTTQFLRVPLDRLDEFVTLVGEMVINRSAIQQQLDDLESPVKDIDVALARPQSSLQELDRRIDHHSRPRSGRFDAVYPPVAVTMPGRTAGQDRDGFDSLEFDQYNELQLLARTLSEANNDVVAAASEIRRVKGEIENLVDRQQRLNRAGQAGLMHIRMVAVNTILSRLERTVRSVSGKLGRPVELELLGGQTELDKTVLEEITDPLLHIIRNAIDHGVEPTSERIAAGKEGTARIRIEAVNQGTQVTLRITDDGAGIHLDKVRRKAVVQGLISEDQPLTSEELHNLIFLPGLSTADKLTDVSGRGVGMDVVRDTVARLKGSVRVDSRAGVGTTFTIQLPTTLSVIRALFVETHRHSFAIPFPAIKEIQRLNPDTVCHSHDGSTAKIGERTVKLKDLASHLQITNQPNSFASNKPLLIIQQGTDEVAISVDRIEGGQDIVIKTLGNHLKRVPGLIGATVRGDGVVIPILDPNDLIGHVTHQPLCASQRPETRWHCRTNTAMVIDDSISVRRVTTNLLQSNGWQVVQAIDGIDALEKLADLETPPDIFLCDMEMPRMDGIELIRQIRHQDEFAATPIVMVTSRSSEKHRHKAFDAGATDYVVKPFQDEHLLELISQLVQSARESVPTF